MTDQLELDYTETAPEISSEKIERLCSFLIGRGWVKAHIIESEIKMNDRDVRKAAEHSDGRIFSFPGSPGYKLFTPAMEIAEFEHGDNMWAAQITRMIERRAAYRRRFHNCARS